jgi:ferric hydroxamate transport system permease protein
LITLLPVAGTWAITGSAFAGATVASVVVFGLASRGGLESDRLVLVGIGVAAVADALITVVIVLSDPYSIAKTLTWLSGSTYGRTLPQVAPVLLVLLLAVPLLWRRTARWTCSPSTTTPPAWSGSDWNGRARCCSAWPACSPRWRWPRSA